MLAAPRPSGQCMERKLRAPVTSFDSLRGKRAAPRARYDSVMPDTVTPFGHALRRWRASRRLSQLDLALRAGTPPRHVSFLETGRARPTQAMVLRLADALDVPLHDRNALLRDAGFAATFDERPLTDEALAAVRAVIARLLAAHEPFPAVVLDRWYDVLDATTGARALFLGGAALPVAPRLNLVTHLLGPLRSALVNWEEVAVDALWRLRREAGAAPDDERLGALLAELEQVAGPLVMPRGSVAASPVLLARLRSPFGEIATVSTIVHFGGARDVTVEGLRVELIYPADTRSEAILRRIGTET